MSQEERMANADHKARWRTCVQPVCKCLRDACVCRELRARVSLSHLPQRDSLMECSTTRIVYSPACSPLASALYFSCGFCA